MLLHEVDLCVVGISSLAFCGAHHTSLAVGSMEATTHVIHVGEAGTGDPEPPEVVSFTGVYCVIHVISGHKHASLGVGSMKAAAHVIHMHGTVLSCHRYCYQQASFVCDMS